MKRAELLKMAEGYVKAASDNEYRKWHEIAQSQSIHAIACILLAKELREGGDVDEGENHG